MQEIINSSKIEKIVAAFEDNSHKALHQLDIKNEKAFYYLTQEFFYFLGVLTGVGMSKPETSKTQLKELFTRSGYDYSHLLGDFAELDEDFAEDLETLEKLESFNQVIKNLFTQVIEDVWELLEEYISKLDKILSLDEEFEIPAKGFESINEDFEYENFADGIMFAIIILENLEIDGSEKTRETLIESLYPLMLLANFSSDYDEDDLDEDVDLEEFEEEIQAEYVQIIEDLEVILSHIYSVIKSY